MKLFIHEHGVRLSFERSFKKKRQDIEVVEFVNLWEAIHGVQLNEDLEDQITWRWTKNGEYATHSAYNI